VAEIDLTTLDETAGVAPEREILSWELFGAATRALATEIADDGFRPDVVLAIVREEIAEHVAEARCAVLYHKPWSVIVPEYVWAHTDRWINFPWSSQHPVVSANNRDA
jgi:hypoxanthine phosphoribosyltransferase